MKLAVAACCLTAAAHAAVSITANTTAVRHLDYVNTTAVGLTPNTAYFLGIYFPANASVQPRAPMTYPATPPWTENAAAEWVDLVSDASGALTFTWRVVNALSDDLQVYIFSGTSSSASPAVLAGTGAIVQLDGESSRSARVASSRAPVWMARRILTGNLRGALPSIRPPHPTPQPPPPLLQPTCPPAATSPA